jgi:hypothetical protein
MSFVVCFAEAHDTTLSIFGFLGRVEAQQEHALRSSGFVLTDWR